jgi:hypothetical protein
VEKGRNNSSSSSGRAGGITRPATRYRPVDEAVRLARSQSPAALALLQPDPTTHQIFFSLPLNTWSDPPQASDSSVNVRGYMAVLCDACDTFSDG